MPNSTVSSKVSNLEKRLGTTLIQRTTRKLHITPAGEAYYNRCVTGVQAIESAEAEIVASQAEPRGLLRLTAPVDLGSSVLPAVVSDFMEKYPAVNVEVILTDRRVDLVGEGIDVALRAGALKDSSLMVKKLGLVYFALFASPAYLKANGIPKTPKELRSHKFVQFTVLGASEWKLSSAKSSMTIPLPGRIIINDLNMIKALAIAGSGIALLAPFGCQSEIRSGKLVRILPEWISSESQISFVYPGQRFPQPKLSAFISFATEPIKKNLQTL